jgi:hypothetical protein
MLHISRGQFLCRTDSCSLMVRFDDKPAARFSAAEPADNSSTLLFIRDYSRFLRETRAAKVVRIEALFFQNGSRVFEFDVAGLDFDASNKAAAPRPAPTPAQRAAAIEHQQDIMRGCNTEATKRELRGTERRDFMSSCLRVGGPR